MQEIDSPFSFPSQSFSSAAKGPTSPHVAPRKTGEDSSLVLESELTGHRVAVWSGEVATDEESASPLHANEDKIFLVQSGAIEFCVNGQIFLAKAGDVVFVPRGESHSLKGLESHEKNRLTLVLVAVEMEKFFTSSAEQFPALCESSKGCHVRSHSSPKCDVYGESVTIYLDTEATEGAYDLVLVESPRGSGPPAHIHAGEDELFLIVAGEFEFTLGKDKHLVSAGDVVWGPRHHVHTFRARSQEGAKMWILIMPGGLHQFFRDCASALAQDESPEILFAAGARYGVSFVFSRGGRGASFEC